MINDIDILKVSTVVVQKREDRARNVKSIRESAAFVLGLKQ